jgi:competence protein ComEC
MLALPLVMYHFHLASPIALMLNLFLWIPLSIALLSGFATMVLSWCPLAAVPAALCEWSLDVLCGCVTLFDGLPGGHFWVSGPPTFAIVLFYGVIGACLAFPVTRRYWKRSLGIAVALFLACAWFGNISVRESDALSATFISVGHGTCVVLELPGDEVWLYDAGRLGVRHAAVREISSFLWMRNITEIHGVLLSHADVDHFNALPGLARRFQIGAVYMSPPMAQSAEPALRTLMNELEAARVPVRIVQAGQAIPTATDVRMSVLYPGNPPAAADADTDQRETDPHACTDNEDSVVVCVDHQNRRILLPGDLEGVGMDQLLATSRLDCDLVMAPHHGSHHSNPAQFCQWATPEWVVISGGHERSVRQGRQVFEDSGATVLRTTQDGAIQAEIREGVLTVRSFHPARG